MIKPNTTATTSELSSSNETSTSATLTDNFVKHDAETFDWDERQKQLILGSCNYLKLKIFRFRLLIHVFF